MLTMNVDVLKKKQIGYESMYKATLTLVLASFLVTGCGGDNTKEPIQPTDNERVEVGFFPSAILSLPSIIIESPAGGSGTLQISESAPPEKILNPAETALDNLSGWSTTAPFYIGLSGAVEPSSLELGTSFRIFENVLNPETPSMMRELTADEVAISVVTYEEGSLPPYAVEVTPKVPLKPNTIYGYAITSQLQDANGLAVEADVTYQLAAYPEAGAAISPTLLQLQEMIQTLNAQLKGVSAVMGAPFADDASIIYSSAFTTQDTRTALEKVRDDIATQSNPITVYDTQYDTAAVGGLGAASIYTGFMNTPYYLGAGSAVTDSDFAILSTWQHQNGDGSWEPLSRNNAFVATQKSSQTIPVLVTKPKTAKPDAGYPVVIFQHGITRSRADMLAVADAFASQGFVGIAIDIPMHGLTESEDAVKAQLNALLSFPGVTERHFNIDFDNGAALKGPTDGKVDASGANFFFLGSLLNIGDNLRQGVVDLLNVSNNVDSIDFEMDGVADIDTSRVFFVGHSLGAIIGSSFVSLDSRVKAAVLANPGGGLIKQMVNADSFKAILAAGLEASDLLPSTPSYDQFLYVGQAAIDAGDPINHAANLKASGLPVLAIEVLGDAVVPNNVATAPLSGTDPLVQQMGLTSLTGTTQSADALQVLINLAIGHHGSLLSTCTIGVDQGCDENTQAALSQVRTELQTAMMSFLVSQGHAVQLSHSDWLLP